MDGDRVPDNSLRSKRKASKPVSPYSSSGMEPVKRLLNNPTLAAVVLIIIFSWEGQNVSGRCARKDFSPRF